MLALQNDVSVCPSIPVSPSRSLSGEDRPRSDLDPDHERQPCQPFRPKSPSMVPLHEMETTRMLQATLIHIHVLGRIRIDREWKMAWTD
jgi:hypothetical protein